MGKVVNQFEEDRNLAASQKGKALMPTNLHGKTLKYPSDLENANGHYMIFNIYTRIDKDKANDAVDLNISTDQLQTFNNTFTSERFFDATTNLSWKEGESGAPVKLIHDTIALYMPDDVSVSFKSNYEFVVKYELSSRRRIGDFKKEMKNLTLLSSRRRQKLVEG